MWKFTVLIICLSGYCLAGPVGSKRNMPIVQQRNEDTTMAQAEPASNVDANELMIMSSLSLPSNATSIRADITDGFSCANKTYGYYADVDNECQIFHVCLPVAYADGKENTFRWSFICPEETIFSQDSFTCMRPDDMTISCEESYQYYELNRNFGIMESNADKESSNEAGSVNAEGSETVAEADLRPESADPVVQHEEEKIVGPSKPVNVPKPSRRKPTISYGTQKKPANTYPLRKIPPAPIQSQAAEAPAIQISEDASDNIKPVEKEEAKPTVFKFSRRPVPVFPNSFKDKIQNTNTESVIPSRTELFTQIRKRPTLFDRKPAEQPKDEDRMEQPKINTEQQGQHNFSPVASDMPVSNSETQVADTEIEASESNNVVVRPEEEADETQNAAVEPVQVLEAFEEIPAVISEVVEVPNAEEDETNNEQTLAILSEKSNDADEPQITEEVQSAEETQSDEEIHEHKEETQASPETSDEVQTVVGEYATEKTEAADETKPFQETQPVEETAEVQQSLRTSSEEMENVDKHKIAEEVQTEEKFEEAEKPQDDAEVQQNVEKIQNPEHTQAPEETQMAEEPEISEEIKTIEEIPAVEKTETAQKINPAEEEVLESHQSLGTAAEEIRDTEETVIAEESPIAQAAVEESTAKQVENVKNIQVAETSQIAEDNQEGQTIPHDEGDLTVEGNQAAQYVQNNKDSNGIDHINNAQTQQEVLEVEEPQPIVHTVEESQAVEEPMNMDDSKPVKENAEPEQVPAIKDSELVQSESLNSEEGVNVDPVQTIEQMEAEKPAETPESLQATEEMSHPHTIVQQMYENMDMNKQSMGGFKPVDPAMAHEAEKLIVDFINTLRKNDFTNETPGMQVEHQITEVSEEQQHHRNGEGGEAEKVESNEETQEKEVQNEEQEDKDKSQAEISENEDVIQGDTQDHSQSDAVEDNNEESQDVHNKEEESNQGSNVETEDVNELSALKPVENQKSEETSAEAMSLPEEMYQIPVQVITSPVEEIPMKEEEQPQEYGSDSAEPTINTDDKTQEELPAMPMVGNKPLSIDDIVELVKERLDHMPKDEMETPMQLEEVIGEAQEDKAVQEKVEEQLPVETEEQLLLQTDEQLPVQVDEQLPIQADEQKYSSQSEEEIVMPIYQRTVQPVQVDAAVQTETLEQVVNEQQPDASESVTEVKEKAKRSYRPRRVSNAKKDSRKRRFLFKADSS